MKDIKIIANPRKENGDLGDMTCTECGCKSSVYYYSPFYQRICKGCILEIVKKIDESILTF